MKKILIGLIIVIFSIGFVGCRDIHSSNNNNYGFEQTETKNPNEHKVGEIINFYGEEITVTNVERNYNTINKYAKPDSGNEFIKVTITVKNLLDKKISINPLEFKIKDTNGEQDPLSFESYSVEDKFDSTELNKDESKTGSMVFEVTKGASDLTLVYQPNFIADKQLLIKL